MIETILLSVFAYVGTNLDDILMDTLYFSGVEGRRSIRKVILGKYLGIFTLVAISLLAARGLQLLPETYLRFLGFLPIALGLKAVYENFHHDDEEEGGGSLPQQGLCRGMFLLSLANGSDNIGVYTPLFTSMESWQLAILLAVFILMVYLFCRAAQKLSELPLLQRLLLGKKQLIVPLVYFALGLYILLEL